MRIFDGDVFKALYYSDEYIKHVRSNVAHIFCFIESGYYDGSRSDIKREYIKDHKELILGDTAFVLASKYSEAINSEKIIIFNDLENADLSINSNKKITLVSKDQNITIILRKGICYIFAIDDQKSCRNSSSSKIEKKQILINVENNKTIEVPIKEPDVIEIKETPKRKKGKPSRRRKK